MARFAQAAIAGGAAAIRANGPDHIQGIRGVTGVPIIGIQKSTVSDGGVLITPSLDVAAELKRAGADLIALDATRRGQRYGALGRIGLIKRELGIPVLADIATVEEALQAAEAGADFVLSTMRGYTAETKEATTFDASFIEKLAAVSPIPVIAEGRIHKPEQAAQAIAAGAFAVVVGTAITRPSEIARQFSAAIERQSALRSIKRTVLAIDMGGTQTKAGIVLEDGTLLYQSSIPTPAMGGRQKLLDHLKQISMDLHVQAIQHGYAPQALGVATAGWVNAVTGTVAYATHNLPGWTGTHIAEELNGCIKLPVAVENDANAFALAEKSFGAGRALTDFVSITLGTGVGGGCFIGNRLNRGAHFFANALGHIPIVASGLACTCGKRGCLEVYCNAAALLRYGADGFGNVEQIISAANSGQHHAQAALRIFTEHLAQGCSILVNLFDPQALILAGGLVQNNPQLLDGLRQQLSDQVSVWTRRELAVIASPLGYYGGVLGAAAIAFEKINTLIAHL
jgi:glucokinase